MTGAQPSKKGLWAAFILFNLIALPALFFLGRYVAQERASARPALPVLGTLRPFSLKGTDGRDFELENMKGRPWVANFMFTSCPNECPAMNFKMGLLQGTMPGTPGLISFSVDPEKDTPEVLAGYAQKFKARKGEWYFLTGSPETVGRLLEDCHFENTGNPNLHGLRLLLLDGEARIRGYYDYADEAAVKKLADDLKLLKEKG